ncbi:dynein axonemal heavy chain 6-like isoform X3 [Convolutriloba macropyga]|uniref:dynein axonemal heavy chain 6-like isoform X3 n=1 Tax=Convolutriloba macropyga TaxID=536237 RepID=UPI003F523B2F
MDELLFNRLNQVGSEAEALRAKGRGNDSIDTSKRSILPPIAPPDSPIPQFRYRRDKKASVAFADLRSNIENNIAAKASNSHRRTEGECKDNVISQEQRALSASVVQSRATSKTSLKSSVILNEDEFVKSLLAEADKQLSELRRKETTIKSATKKKTRIASASPVPDASVILMRNQTNLFDDQVPDGNRDVYYHLKKLRSALNLPTELPRHGPDVRDDLKKLARIEEEIFETSEEDGNFVYCLPKHRRDRKSRYDPYDIEVVSPEEARGRKEVFTASMSAITLVKYSPDGSKIVVRTPVLRWMYEARLFRMIFDKSVFAKFRIWKTFKLWRANVRSKKKAEVSGEIERELLTNTDALLLCLLHVRSICQSACPSNSYQNLGTTEVCLISLDPKETIWLADFMTNQKRQCSSALDKLLTMRDNIVEIAKRACLKVAQDEAREHGIEPAKLMHGEFDFSRRRKENTSPYTALAVWKHILRRLSKFLRLVDNQMLDMLQRLVINATSHLWLHVDGGLENVRRRMIQAAEDEKKLKEEEEFKPRLRSGGFKRSLGPDDFQSNQDNQNNKKEYVIPKYDFNAFKIPKKTVVDIDEILGSIIKKEKEDELPEPLFNVRLQLNVTPLRTVSSKLVKSKSSMAPTASGFDSRQDFASKLRVPSHVTFHDEDNQIDSENNPDEVPYDPNQPSVTPGDDDRGTVMSEDNESVVSEQSSIGASSSAGGTLIGYFGRFKESQQGEVYTSLFPSLQDFKDNIVTCFNLFESTVGQVCSLLREPELKLFYEQPKVIMTNKSPTSPKRQSKESKSVAKQSKKSLRLGSASNPRLSGGVRSRSPSPSPSPMMFLDEEDVAMLNLRPWPDLDLVFGLDNWYQDNIDKLITLFNDLFEEIDEYSVQFDQFCDMVNKSRRVDVDYSMKQKEWLPEDFFHVLSTHTEHRKLMNAMPLLKFVGMLKVDTEHFRDVCLPYPMKVLNSVYQKLPKLANQRNEDLLSIVRNSNNKLDHYPESVEEFVDHLTFLQKIQSDMSALEKEFGIVTRLFTLIKDFEVPINAEDQALFQTLGPSFQSLKSTILYCEAKKDENIRKFSDDLEKIISKLRDQLMGIRIRVQHPDLLNQETMSQAAIETIRLLGDEIEKLTGAARSYSSYQERFGSTLSSKKKNADYLQSLLSDAPVVASYTSEVSAQTVQSELNEIERDLTLRRMLWESQEEWHELIFDWTHTPFVEIVVESMQKHVNKFNQTIFMLEKGLPANEILPQLKERVTSFKTLMPLIVALRNPNLRDRHWGVIFDLVGNSSITEITFTLGNLLETKALMHKTAIGDISTRATNEATLEQMLQKVIELWAHTEFRLVAHPQQGIMMLAGADDILTQLEECQVTIGTIRGSRFVEPIKASVEEWERKLIQFSRALDEWMTCQRNWVYLEQIFNTPDIQRQLPNEWRLFSMVDKNFKDIMRRTEDRPNALQAATIPGTIEILQTSNGNLEKIMQCLEDYLETKRLVFPRFYFLSNDELLDILAQSKDPSAVQPHLVKCFSNVKALDMTSSINKQTFTVSQMISAEGEVLNLSKSIRVRGAVETWLGSVESGMFEAVRKHMRQGIRNYTEMELKQWVLKNPGQVVLSVFQLLFCNAVEESLNSAASDTALGVYFSTLVDQLNQLTELVSQALSVHHRFAIEALLTVSVHSRDILNGLINSGVNTVDAFDWTRQIKLSWEETRNIILINHGVATFEYGDEYLGCSPRLVITPLTDRCYMTLTSALHMHLGGSPAGPAGTGKTETVKDLAKTIGKFCVVFNCSESLDYKMMGKFFSGIAQSGSWVCFDEFNRIDIEVLSVIAQQIQSIKSAKTVSASRLVFEGKDIKLNLTCGYFITMNPTYAGRVELPDNLKSLFRQVAMMVPDYALIAEIILSSAGFSTAKSLSTKIVNLYQLASKQLSQQDHYDFGMRAIKSVLVMAGQRKSSRILSRKNVTSFSEEEESLILISSLQDANLPKFIAEDVVLFEGILADLFPGVSTPQTNDAILQKAINLAIMDLGITSWTSQRDKVFQLHSQLLVRHGVMLVGPTSGGKTVVRNILQKALYYLPALDAECDEYELHSKHLRRKGRCETVSINPKCITMGELYGEINMNTLEWHDGILATHVRRFVSESSATTSDEAVKTSGSADRARSSKSRDEAVSSSGAISDWKWLILDGPVDTLWVENLNTVLDDSKVLCLANGERISLTPDLRLMFEVDNLSQASPATISRCAMVYMDPIDLGWKPYVATWLKKLPKQFPPKGQEFLNGMFDHFLEAGLKFVRSRSTDQHIRAPELSMVKTLCTLLEAYIEFLRYNGGFGFVPADDEEEEVNDEQQSRVSLTGKSKRNPKKGGATSTGKWYLEKHPGNLETLLSKLFVFCFTWALGGNFRRVDDAEDQDGSFEDVGYDFDNFVRELFECEPPYGVRLPSGNQTVYAYFVDIINGGFVLWNKLVPSTKYLVEKGIGPLDDQKPAKKSKKSKGQSGGSGGGGSSSNQSHSESIQLVPTVDSVRYSFLTVLLTLYKNPVILTGESGIGKSAIVQDLLGKVGQTSGLSTHGGTVLGRVLNYSDRDTDILDNVSHLLAMSDSRDKGGTIESTTDETAMLSTAAKEALRGTVIASVIQFSAQTHSHKVQSQLLYKLIKRGKDGLTAPKGKRVVAFIDDINMPMPEKFGSQPPLELIRQLLETGGFYVFSKLQWKNVHDVSVIAACGPPGGGRQNMSPRLLSQFRMLALPHPSESSLRHVFTVRLGHFLESKDFLQDVKEQREPLVNAAIGIYNSMSKSMLPTPAKIHYTFNLRDLSQVITGLFQADDTVVISRESAASLLAHEATRVFHDRLIDDEDRRQFFRILIEELHNHFKIKMTLEAFEQAPLLYGDFLDLNAPSINRVYRPMQSTAQIAAILEEFHLRTSFGGQGGGSGGSGGATKDMSFFQECVVHICRVSRVFRQEGGHLLLVGLDGTGKTTTVQIAAKIAQCELYRLTITRNYGVSEFREELKTIFKTCGGSESRKLAFLVTDSDLIMEDFLEDINSILNSGEVPELFDKEEIDGICIDIKNLAMEKELPDTQTALYGFFLERVKCNLHIVLALSPAGTSFRHRCRMHPSIVNCCTIDWIDEWSDSAMLTVAQMSLAKLDFKQTYAGFVPRTKLIEIEQVEQTAEAEEQESTSSDDIPRPLTGESRQRALKEALADSCVKIYKSVRGMSHRFYNELRRHYYVTPSSYLKLMKLYSILYVEKLNEILENRDRLKNGIDKLSEANASVSVLQKQLVSLGPEIEEKTIETEKTLALLKEDQAAVEEVIRLVAAEEKVMTRETQIVQEYAQQAKAELDAVEPKLQAAIQSLDQLNKTDISEVRVYNNPPVLVLKVMSAVCCLLQKTPNWPTAKLLLGDPGFVDQLVALDSNKLPDRVFKNLEKYTRSLDFTPENVKKVSLACMSICNWVLAMESHYRVIKMVQPKQARVKEAKEALSLAEKNLQRKQKSLKLIQDHMKMLQDAYEGMVQKVENLKLEKVLSHKRIARASLLTDALAGEKDRWISSIAEFEHLLDFVAGDALVCAAGVAFNGAFNASMRNELLNQFKSACVDNGIKLTDGVTLTNGLSQPHEVLKLYSEGLPKDSHSTDNALIIKKNYHFPLIIDPQGQAVKWISQMAGEKLKKTKLNDPNMLRTLENALRVGDPILIEGFIEEVDPGLTPVLLKQTSTVGGQEVVTLGDREVEFNSNFMLYMVTALSNPHYLPTVCIKVNLVNFMVTFEGLQDQLLSTVVQQEKPLLEEQKRENFESLARDTETIRELQRKSLRLLQSSEGHLLDQQDLVETLQQSKVISAEIKERIEISKVTAEHIQTVRDQYLPVAKRAAILYFVLADLSQIDVMYQFSLPWYANIFQRSIDSSQSAVGVNDTFSSHDGMASMSNFSDDRADDEGENLSALLNSMSNRLTENVFKVVSQAIFSQDLLLFSFHIYTSIERAANHITAEEWNVFLHTDTLSDLAEAHTLAENETKPIPYARLSKIVDPNTEKSLFQWLSPVAWKQCQFLSTALEVFQNLNRYIIANPYQWLQFGESGNPMAILDKDPITEETANMSVDTAAYDWTTLTDFQKLILIKVLRPDAFVPSVRQCITTQMGSRYVAGIQLDMSELYHQATHYTPLIFLLSPGSDPVAQLMKFAVEERGSALHIDMISLGRGQGPRAEELISKAQILKNRWVFLQNCHLAASFMPRLQEIVEGFSKPNADVDLNFRLWLSSKPDASFPIPILQQGLKMTIENPQGIKGSLGRIFGSGSTSVISESIWNQKSDIIGSPWKKLLYSLCMFNCVVVERKKFGALGWNIPYEFTQNDLDVAILQLETFLGDCASRDGIPWHALLYMTGELVYGGRVTDDFDRTCLATCMRRFYHDGILGNGFSFTSDQVYRVPSDLNESFSGIQNLIQELPADDLPEIFGMHANAQKSFQIMGCESLVDQMKSLQPRMSSGTISAGQSDESIVLNMVTDMLFRVPEVVEQHGHSTSSEKSQSVSKGGTTGSSKDPLAMPTTINGLMKFVNDAKMPSQNQFEKKKPVGDVEAVSKISQSALVTCLRQEIDRFNRLLSVMRKTLTSLQLAIQGIQVMSDELEEAFNALIQQRIPKMWQVVAYESCATASVWVSDLCVRVEFMSTWSEIVLNAVQSVYNGIPLSDGKEGSAAGGGTYLNPRAFWLPAFFFPQGFITSVLQSHARETKVSIDSLSLSFSISHNPGNVSNIKEQIMDTANRVEKGVLIFGLFIDGAGWDGEHNTLKDLPPGVRFSSLPEIHMVPVQNDTAQTTRNSITEPGFDVTTSTPIYSCPLYRTPLRTGTMSSTGHSTNYVMCIDIPIEGYDSDYWITRGTALLCQTT